MVVCARCGRNVKYGKRFGLVLFCMKHYKEAESSRLAGYKPKPNNSSDKGVS